MPIFTAGSYSLGGRAGKHPLPEGGERLQVVLVEPVEEARAHLADEVTPACDVFSSTQQCSDRTLRPVHA